ncbi:hypothetical protein R6Q57_012632 [Mikania cordata]
MEGGASEEEAGRLFENLESGGPVLHFPSERSAAEKAWSKISLMGVVKDVETLCSVDTHLEIVSQGRSFTVTIREEELVWAPPFTVASKVSSDNVSVEP